MVSCGNAFTACVTDGGKLYTCGKGSSLSLGHGNRSYTPHPALVESLRDRKVKKVACGGKHMVSWYKEIEGLLTRQWASAEWSKRGGR